MVEGVLRRYGIISHYINHKGEVVEIITMADAHLLNAYAHYHKRYETLAQKKVDGQYTDGIRDLTEALLSEIKRRGLL